MKHNKIPTPAGSELTQSPISPRFSLADKAVHREDDTFTDGYRTQRIITYPRPRDEAATHARDWLMSKGCVWGEEVETGNEAVLAYRIPNGLRPLTHDSKGYAPSEFVYGDAELFFDVGKLLGQVAQSGSELPNAIQYNIGHHIAIKEFSRMNEPKVLLVPGFEAVLGTLNTDDELLEHYTGELFVEFGDQFVQNTESFTEGFNVGLN